MRRRTAVSLSLGALAGCALPPSPTHSSAEPPSLPTPVSSAYDGPLVFGHLCTWLKSGERGDNWRQTSVQPVGGPYSSQDPAVLKRQMEEMNRMRMAPMLSWHGHDGSGGDGYLDMFVSVPDPVIPAALLYEGQGRLHARSDGWLDFDDAANRQQLADDMYHFHERYLSRHPDRFARINGRFVVMLWPSHIYRGPFAAVGQELMRQLPLFFVGTDVLMRPYIRPDAADVVPGFAAESAYGLYLPEVASEPGIGTVLNHVWLNRWQTMTNEWDRWLDAHAPNVKLMLPLQFAFDDSKTIPPRGNPPLVTDYAVADEMVLQSNAMVADSEKSGGRILRQRTLSSFSEWFEGSGVEENNLHGIRHQKSLKLLV